MSPMQPLIDMMIGDDMAAGADDKAGAGLAAGLAGFGIGAAHRPSPPRGFGAVNSPAPSIPWALTVLTQLASTASSGAVEVRLKFKTLPPDTATIRLAFWNVRATFGGRMAVAMMSDVAVANSLAWDCPSKVTSIGTVLPLVK